MNIEGLVEYFNDMIRLEKVIVCNELSEEGGVIMNNKSCPIPDCPCCKHCYDSDDVNHFLCCSAFPNGIPNDYLFGPVQVKNLKECNNGYKYEEVVK